jgi:carbonic anhydrase
MDSAQEALQRLRDGNRRFVSDLQGRGPIAGQTRRSELVAEQSPFAIILGCSDSRVPAEIIFDQGLGDLFVIRVAGNIVAPSQIGSVEYAVEQYGVPLVLVIGHSMCGAVQAALEDLNRPLESRSPNLHSIVSRIQPAVQALLDADNVKHSDDLLAHAVRANIRTSVDGLSHGSEIIEKLIRSEKLLIVGAEYSIETGLIDFFDGSS